jgi:hypothetical protein
VTASLGDVEVVMKTNTGMPEEAAFGESFKVS